MEGKIIKFMHNDVEIAGEIIMRKHSYFMVEILKPFCNYKAIVCYKDFGCECASDLHKNHEKYITSLLIEMYERLMWFDVRIERCLRKYDLYLEHMNAMNSVKNPEIKESIERLIVQDFFNVLFSNKPIRFLERNQILTILEIYKMINFKLYVP